MESQHPARGRHDARLIGGKVRSEAGSEANRNLSEARSRSTTHRRQNTPKPPLPSYTRSTPPLLAPLLLCISIPYPYLLSCLRKVVVGRGFKELLASGLLSACLRCSACFRWSPAESDCPHHHRHPCHSPSSGHHPSPATATASAQPIAPALLISSHSALASPTPSTHAWYASHEPHRFHQALEGLPSLQHPPHHSLLPRRAPPLPRPLAQWPMGSTQAHPAITAHPRNPAP